ncbi:MAG: GIY-YIG nuclease family protein [Candidatus Thiodubiliella endoseptemdiera]|uniref:GIY-YIG nuclease family protein n=1 Tax=Candidatus Thiodubiliella endoseptemdiera TaxID=2738886 RepID=A0A853EZU2_9GAMM|nr:GIY-YIG nuclease family protein [Candidatus Thiodubiliella endoseptemdiera]
MSNNKIWLVYLLECTNNTLYCGVTNDIKKRLRQHNGEIIGGAKYTRANGPCELVYQENAKDRSTAQKRECEIKALSRSEKLTLIRQRPLHKYE